MPADSTIDDSPSEDPAVGRVVAGKFAIVRRIAEGAMGVVYEARHVSLDVPVALKLLHAHLAADPQFSQRFEREARITCSFVHVNSVRVFDCGTEADGTLYLAMEFIDGEDLWTLLRREVRVEPTRIVHLLLQVLSALGAAHGKGVVHRDMKPENVMIVAGFDDNGDPSEVAKVCDFGIASIGAAVVAGTTGSKRSRSERGITGPRLTQQGLVIGTPAYMSPEQARGEPIDARSDLYSVGVILYQLLTGVPPFDAETPLGIVLKHLTEAPLPPSRHFADVHPGLAEVALRSLEKAPGDRYQTARAMRTALRNAIGVHEPDPRSTMPDSRELANLLTPAELMQQTGMTAVDAALSRSSTVESRLSTPGPVAFEAPPSGQPTSGATHPVSANLGPPPSVESRRTSRLAIFGGVAALAALAFGAFRILHPAGASPTASAVVSSAPRVPRTEDAPGSPDTPAGNTSEASSTIATNSFARAAPPSTARAEDDIEIDPPSGSPLHRGPASASSSTAPRPRDLTARAEPAVPGSRAAMSPASAPSTSSFSALEVAPPTGSAPEPAQAKPEPAVVPPSPPSLLPSPSSPTAPPPPAAPPPRAVPTVFRVDFASVLNDRGVTPRSVESGFTGAMPRITECYRAAGASNPASGSGAVHVETDGEGVIVSAVTRGALAPAAARCIERTVVGLQFSGVDTGEATADVSLSFHAE